MPVIWSLISCCTSKAGLSLYICMDIQKVRFQQVGSYPPASRPHTLLLNTDHVAFLLFFARRRCRWFPHAWVECLDPELSRFPSCVVDCVLEAFPTASGLCFIPFISLNCRSHDIIQRPGTGRRAIIQPVGELGSREARVCLIPNHLPPLCLHRTDSVICLPAGREGKCPWWMGVPNDSI